MNPRPLLLVRTFIPLAILGDLLAMAWRGALQPVLFTATDGGLSATIAAPYWFRDVTAAGPLLYTAAVVAAVFSIAGVRPRISLAVLLVASAQLGHLFTPGDRAIDRLLRTALVVLLCSSVTDRRLPATIAAWPADLLRYLLVIVYLSAGFNKLPKAARWLDPNSPELYRVLTDPLNAHLDPAFWDAYPWPFVVGGAATLVLELGAPVLLTRFRTVWALPMAAMHLGIAAWMELGVFSWGMLAFFPLLLDRWPFERRSVLERFYPVAASGGSARVG